MSGQCGHCRLPVQWCDWVPVTLPPANRLAELVASEDIIHRHRAEWHKLIDGRKAIPQLQGVIDDALPKQAVASQECRSLREEVISMNSDKSDLSGSLTEARQAARRPPAGVIAVVPNVESPPINRGEPSATQYA